MFRILDQSTIDFDGNRFGLNVKKPQHLSNASVPRYVSIFTVYNNLNLCHHSLVNPITALAKTQLKSSPPYPERGSYFEQTGHWQPF